MFIKLLLMLGFINHKCSSFVLYVRSLCKFLFEQADTAVLGMSKNDTLLSSGLEDSKEKEPVMGSAWLKWSTSD